MATKRRGALRAGAPQPVFESVQGVSEVLHRPLRAWRMVDEWPRIMQCVPHRAVRVGELREIQPDAVPREQRLERGSTREQAMPGLMVRSIAQPPPVRVAEDV